MTSSLPSASRTFVSRGRVRSASVALAIPALVAGGTVATAPAASAATDPCTTVGTTSTCIYTYTGAEQTFTVPAGVTTVTVDAVGAAGGPGRAASGQPPVLGGAGAEVSGSIDVTGVPTLYVEVGGIGGTQGNPYTQVAAFNGGGFSIYGGGGGASDVRTASRTTSLATADTRLLVAAGGGGGGDDAMGCGSGPTSGGAGGAAGEAGQPGSGAATGCGAGGGGGAGQQTATANGGVSPEGAAHNGAAGTLGTGGEGGTYTGDQFGETGGGGGGGVYGGGGGADASFLSGGDGGGGGGSSRVPAGGTGPTATTAPPSITISYDTAPVAASTTTTLSSSPNPSVVGQQVTYTATVSPVPDGGTVAIGAQLSPIAGCGALPVASDGTATCMMTYQTAGTYPVYAKYSGDAGFSSSTGSVDQVVQEPAQPQTITVTSTPPDPAYPSETYSPVATADSGLPVAVSVDSATAGFGRLAAACTLDAGVVTFRHAGECVLDFDQAGDATHTPAPRVQQEISVSPIGVTASAALSPESPVYGQDASVKVTATVSAGPAALIGTPVTAGSVTFSDGVHDFGPQPVGADGSVTFASLLAPGPLPAGQHDRSAAYVPPAGSDYTAVNQPGSFTVGQAATATAVRVDAATVSATVSAVAPGAGTPTGLVTFSLDGSPIGTAPLVGGTATLQHAVPAGRTRAVAAEYSGDANFLASSNSTARQDPSITARVISSQPRSRYGWYRTPVTVSFTCTPHGAPLTEPCPAPVTLTRNRAALAVTRTIAATDGGMATVTVQGINIDRILPRLKITGVRNGARYAASAPTVRCASSDALSGIASCRLTSRTRTNHGAERITWTATATDKAGNTRTATLTVTVAGFGFVNAPFSGGAYTVRRGHTYTLVGFTHGTRPRYVDAAPYPLKPRGLDHWFQRAGHVGRAQRWALGVTMEYRLRSHRYWNVGVLVGHTLYTIKIRVVG